MTSNSTTQPCEQDGDRISFFDLPYEIRIRIYNLVHLSSPVQHPQLMAWYCIPNLRTYTVQAISARDGVDESVLPKSTAKQLHPDGLLSPTRPLCRIPTGLARSCRQIHAESCAIPFQENEFVFVNWFSLGLSSALAFMRGREQWQRATLRFMRLEVFTRDLAADSAKFADWLQLCEHLPGLKGLRLMLYVDGGVAYSQNFGTGTGMMGTGAAPVAGKEIEDAQKLVRERPEWVVEGLKKLRELRQLEVELVDAKWSAREKVEWCGRLRELLEASGGGSGTKVVCVEKL